MKKFETFQLLPIPDFFNSEIVREIWRVPYQQRAAQARAWAKQYGIQSAAEDKTRIGLLLIDVQNTFCLPEFELFVGGRSGEGAIEDNIRLCEFIYHNLPFITEIFTTLDTHTAWQIFHPIFWVDGEGNYPNPATAISLEDIQQGKWQVNPAVTQSRLPDKYLDWQQYALHYVKKLSEQGKYLLTIWPYHAMLGGIGHALVPAVEEAIFFHNIARNSQANFEIKGNNPLTENYSVLRPEVLEDARENPLAQKNTLLLDKLLSLDALIIAGQAKSHCVAWTVDDLLTEILARDPKLTQKIYLLEDCTSPVVVADILDFTEQADAAFQRFAKAGMHLVKSTVSIADFPGL